MMMENAIWNQQSRHDTGSGAIVYVSTSTSWPGVTMREFRSYCGRESDSTWYEAVGDDSRMRFSTPAKASSRYSECVKLRDQSAEIRRLQEQSSGHR
jgi:hypothetical protein